MSWKPSANLRTLKIRAKFINKIRNFFYIKKYLEVETPILSQFGVTDIYLHNIKAIVNNKYYFLQTSPEYHMKRLLACGVGSIFQIFRAFRDDEFGNWHNPEFTMLEWYKINSNIHDIIDETNELLKNIFHCKNIIKKTYQQIFMEYCRIDPIYSTIQDLKKSLVKYKLQNILSIDEQDKDQYLFLLMTHVIEPKLAKESSPIAIYNFPKSQAALAKIKYNISKRFEIYFKGIEIANGFHELSNVSEHIRRFKKDIKTRKKLGLYRPKIDKYFIQALSHGLPNCSGISLGIDRLLAIILGYKSISPVLSFNFTRS